MSEVRKVEAEHTAAPAHVDPAGKGIWMVYERVDGPGTYYIVPEELVEQHEPFSLDYRGRIAIIEEDTE